jgi:hypothetical protein
MKTEEVIQRMTKQDRKRLDRLALRSFLFNGDEHMHELIEPIKKAFDWYEHTGLDAYWVRKCLTEASEKLERMEGRLTELKEMLEKFFSFYDPQDVEEFFKQFEGEDEGGKEDSPEHVPDLQPEG